MSEDKKEVTQKIVDTFTEIEDLREYSNSQYKVIVSQSKKISELERKLESTESKLAKSEQTNTVANALSTDQTGGSNDDGTTICLIQLALLRAAAMNGELTLEETKKVEIYVKTLQVIKGKGTEDKKPKDTGRALTNDELILLMSTVSEQ
jgi:hypothetical protein